MTTKSKIMKLDVPLLAFEDLASSCCFIEDEDVLFLKAVSRSIHELSKYHPNTCAQDIVCKMQLGLASDEGITTVNGN